MEAICPAKRYHILSSHSVGYTEPVKCKQKILDGTHKKSPYWEGQLVGKVPVWIIDVTAEGVLAAMLEHGATLRTSNAWRTGDTLRYKEPGSLVTLKKLCCAHI